MLFKNMHSKHNKLMLQNPNLHYLILTARQLFKKNNDALKKI